MIKIEERINPLTVNDLELEPRKGDLDANMCTLWNRKKGELFYAEGGRLKTMGRLRCLLYRISSTYRNYVNPDVKRVIDHFVWHVFDLPEGNNGLWLKQLFFQKLAPLSRKIYSRCLQDSVIQKLSLNVHYEEGEIAQSASPHYQTTYKAAKFWSLLGNREKPDTGATTTFKILDGNGKVLGIFKPASKETYAPKAPRSWKQALKYHFFNLIGSPIPKMNGGQGYVAEAAASVIERHVLAAAGLPSHFSLVPETHIATLSINNQSERGSFQLWEQANCKSAFAFFGFKDRYCNSGSPSLKEMESQLPTEAFDLFVIIDYASGNCDRHGDNLLIIYNDQNQAMGMRLIDGSRSMPTQHPSWWHIGTKKHQYRWRNFALAHKKFSLLGKETIKKLNQKSLAMQKEIEALYAQEGIENASLTKQRVQCMAQRLKALFRFRDTKTKYALSYFRTQGDFATLAT